jgi:hypothetical protein
MLEKALAEAEPGTEVEKEVGTEVKVEVRIVETGGFNKSENHVNARKAPFTVDLDNSANWAENKMEKQEEEGRFCAVFFIESWSPSSSFCSSEGRK